MAVTEAMKRYECLLCGAVYDPEVGDFEGAIEPGVRFEALPDAWCCPECGAPREEFMELEDQAKGVVHTDDSPVTPALATTFARLRACAPARRHVKGAALQRTLYRSGEPHEIPGAGAD
ncbi:MAG: rubredoxin [Candidatus Methanospirareceae archaeon]